MSRIRRRPAWSSRRSYNLRQMRSTNGAGFLRARGWAGTAELADRESADYLAATPRAEANRKAAVVLITSALSLTILNYGASDPLWFITLLDGLGLDGWAGRSEHAFLWSGHAQRNRLVFWGAGQVFAYTVLPAAAIKLVLRERAADYGLRIRGAGRSAPVYGVLLAASIPFVVAASYTPSFQAKYPFYDLAPGEGLWPDMALWWAVYALQFVALEFFFRGFMVHGLAGRLGYMAVFAMAVPYNMLHYGKPIAEALAAVVGGVVLGSLSLKSRSIWWGAAVHIGVAAAMDVSALVHKGFIP